MIFTRLYDESLAHASYIVGCAVSGEAVVIDPNRDIDRYIIAAGAEGLRIRAIAETHIHADYLSGTLELSKATGATMYLSDEGDADWKYGFADEDSAVLVRDGSSFRIGNLRFDVIATAGHTPEHISFLLTDEAASAEPTGMFTGDFLFVGDVGRPDLLENAAGMKGTMEPGARALFQSLQKLRDLPDHLLIWPAHGAGSACGKSLGGLPVSSLGYERLTNWGLKAADEDNFVREVLSGQPEPPKYFAQMKKLNKVGPPPLRGFKKPGQLSEIGAGSAQVLDVRCTEAFAKSHRRGSLNISLHRTFNTWAGSLLTYDEDIVLVADSGSDASWAARELAMIGLDRVIGWVAPSDALKGGAEGSVKSGSIKQLPEGCVVLDVRRRSEWNSGHLPNAVHIPLGSLPERADELPRDRTICVHCQAGGRSPIAASVLERAGFVDVIDLSDGYEAYRPERGGVAVV